MNTIMYIKHMLSGLTCLGGLGRLLIAGKIPSHDCSFFFSFCFAQKCRNLHTKTQVFFMSISLLLLDEIQRNEQKC